MTENILPTGPRFLVAKIAAVCSAIVLGGTFVWYYQVTATATRSYGPIGPLRAEDLPPRMAFPSSKSMQIDFKRLPPTPGKGFGRPMVIPPPTQPAEK